MKRIVIATFGSQGDLFPYLAIARGLQARGHAPAIATATFHREAIERAGIEFLPMRPNLEDFGDPSELMRRVMDLRTGPEYLVRNMMLPHLRASYEDLLRAARDADLLVSHPLTYALPLIAEKLRLPWISTVLAPLSFMSTVDPPILPAAPWLRRVHALSPALYRMIFDHLRRSVRSWVEPVHALRREIGLAPTDKNPMLEGQFSPTLTLGLFSPLLAEPQSDWPPNTVLTGFPIYEDSALDRTTLSRLDQFLEAGSPPIVFALGSSAVRDAGSFFRESAKAAKQLGMRAILVVGEDWSNRPTELLSDSVVCFEYIPYGYVFPRAAAIVHQGGIGTLAQAMRAGRPMLVVPFAHDQPDNAARAVRLGIARSIMRRKYSAKLAHAELRKLLEQRDYREAATRVGHRLQAEDGVARACDAIENLLSRRDVPDMRESDLAGATIQWSIEASSTGKRGESRQA